MGASRDGDIDGGSGVPLLCHPGVGAVPASTSWGLTCPPFGGSTRALSMDGTSPMDGVAQGSPFRPASMGECKAVVADMGRGVGREQEEPCVTWHTHTPKHSPGYQGPASGSHNKDPTSSLQPLPSSLITQHLINTAIISVKAPPFS